MAKLNRSVVLGCGARLITGLRAKRHLRARCACNSAGLIVRGGGGAVLHTRWQLWSLSSSRNNSFILRISGSSQGTVRRQGGTGEFYSSKRRESIVGAAVAAVVMRPPVVAGLIESAERAAFPSKICAIRRTR